MNELNRLTVIIPAFNEFQSLEQFLPDLIVYCRSRKWKIIIVNDGSTDGTKELLEKAGCENNISIFHHKLNKGYGAAIKTGLMACNTDYAITFDADNQHYPEDIDRLLGVIAEHDADMVIGSRKESSGSSSYRGLGKRVIRMLAKVLMTVPVHDLNSGMKIYNAGLVKRYLHLAPDTMAFSDVITLVFINNRHLVIEEPIRTRERKSGKSSIGLQTAFQTIMEILHIVILFNPMKIFLPLSMICLTFTVLWGLPLLWQGRGLSTGSMLGAVLGILLFLLGLITEQLSQIRKNTGPPAETKK